MAELSHEDEACLYSAGELEERARERFEAHLASCETCRRALKDLARAARLAEEARLPPRPELAFAVLSKTRRRAGWSAADRLRALGLGLGLSFAAGLLLFQISRGARKDYPWRNGLESEMSQAAQDLESLDAKLSRDAWSVEFQESLDDLGRQESGLEGQLAKPEGA